MGSTSAIRVAKMTSGPAGMRSTSFAMSAVTRRVAPMASRRWCDRAPGCGQVETSATTRVETAPEHAAGARMRRMTMRRRGRMGKLCGGRSIRRCPKLTSITPPSTPSSLTPTRIGVNATSHSRSTTSHHREHPGGDARRTAMGRLEIRMERRDGQEAGEMDEAAICRQRSVEAGEIHGPDDVAHVRGRPRQPCGWEMRWDWLRPRR